MACQGRGTLGRRLLRLRDAIFLWIQFKAKQRRICKFYPVKGPGSQGMPLTKKRGGKQRTPRALGMPEGSLIFRWRYGRSRA